MQTITLHALPEIDEEPWTLEYFCERTETICRVAATELHRKSLMVEEAVEEILQLVRKAQQDYPSVLVDDIEFCFDGKLEHFIISLKMTSKLPTLLDDLGDGHTDADSSSTQQQSDWSLVYECFEKPHLLLGGGMIKAMVDMVRGAMGEMRRFYSRKVVDVLVRVTRQSLDALRKRFSISGIYQHYYFLYYY